MVMFRQVISSSSSAASSTIAAPMRLITADSSSARNPERMPPPAPEIPPSHSSPNISHDHSSSLPPEKRAPAHQWSPPAGTRTSRAAQRAVRHAAAKSGSPAGRKTAICRSPLRSSPLNRDAIRFSTTAFTWKQHRTVKIPRNRHTNAPISRRTGRAVAFFPPLPRALLLEPLRPRSSRPSIFSFVFVPP